MWHCIELRSGGRKRLRGVRGVHGSCCGATNGGCDGLGESLVETPGSAGCTRGMVARPSEAQGCAFCETGVRVVKGTASPDVTVRKLTSTFLRAVKNLPFRASASVQCLLGGCGLAASPRLAGSQWGAVLALSVLKAE